jgi:protein-tyrosine-phosphatase
MTPARILIVCSHNRTRSVMIGGLLVLHLCEARVDGAIKAVRAVGFDEPGLPTTTEACRLLAARRVDVRHHRSRRITDDDVSRADLIVTAERMHVVEIAGRWPGAFAKTMTLPELVQRGEGVEGVGGVGFTGWLDAMAVGRPHHLDYLDANIGEIADPTGQSPGIWKTCVGQIDDLTSRAAGLLIRRQATWAAASA